MEFDAYENLNEKRNTTKSAHPSKTKQKKLI